MNKFNKLFNKVGGVVIILAILALGTSFILILRGVTSNNAASPPIGYPGLSRQEDQVDRTTIKPYPAPATSDRKQTISPNSTPLSQLVSEPETPYQLPTSLPDRGVRVGVPIEIARAGVMDIQVGSPIDGLFAPDLDGNLLVAKLKSGEEISLIVINTQSGHTEYITPIVNNNSDGPYIEGNYVVWTESTADSNSNIKQVLLLDLDKGVKRSVWRGNLHLFDLKDDILIWQEYRGESWGIYGYDLIHEQEILIAKGTGTYAWPRICSRDWVIFMYYSHRPEQRQITSADLRAYNLQTGETFSVGQVPLSDSPTTGRSHDCDGTQIAWASFSYDTQSEPLAQQHIYDLQNRAERILDIPMQGFGTRVVIDGDILLSSVGYDLNRNIPFSLWSDDIPIKQRGQMLLSGHRLAWVANPLDPVEVSWRLYTATITQD